MCKWDATEILLKASVMDAERVLYPVWVSAYLAYMTCFPRLNVVSDRVHAVRHHFRSVPNVTFHASSMPEYYTDSFWRIQWPMMRADRFTTAPFILILDVDTPLVSTMRCHHLFDDRERAVWRSWKWVPRIVRWIGLDDAMFRRYGVENSPAFGHDFMNFFPVVVPRSILAVARDVVIRGSESCRNCSFDEAFWKHPRPSYGDILGKSLVILRPSLVHWIHCERLETTLPNACIDFVPIAEHVKHPLQGGHRGGKHISHAKAAVYASRLREDMRNATYIPEYLYHYKKNRTEGERKSIEDAFFSDDRPRRTCGVR